MDYFTETMLINALRGLVEAEDWQMEDAMKLARAVLKAYDKANPPLMTTGAQMSASPSTGKA